MCVAVCALKKGQVNAEIGIPVCTREGLATCTPVCTCMERRSCVCTCVLQRKSECLYRRKGTRRMCEHRRSSVHKDACSCVYTGKGCQGVRFRLCVHHGSGGWVGVADRCVLDTVEKRRPVPLFSQHPPPLRPAWGSPETPESWAAREAARGGSQENQRQALLLHPHRPFHCRSGLVGVGPWKQCLL